MTKPNYATTGYFSCGFRVGLSAGRCGVMSSIPCQVQFLHKPAPSLKTFISCCFSSVSHYEGEINLRNCVFISYLSSCYLRPCIYKKSYSPFMSGPPLKEKMVKTLF